MKSVEERLTACEEMLGLCDPRPAPEKSAIDRLKEAGASVTAVRGLSFLETPRALIQDGKVWLCIDGLTPDRAEAALRAARGDEVEKYPGFCSRCVEGPAKKTLAEADAQLAAKDEEIARLTNEIFTLRSSIAELAEVNGIVTGSPATRMCNA